MKVKVPEKVQERVFAVILKRPENLECADCASKGPRWVSLDYGVFICMNCAGAHRTLGPSITRVRSTKLDEWYQENIDILEAIGNQAANSYWENQLGNRNYHKPPMNASLESLTRFVNEKYVKKLFIPNGCAMDPKSYYMQTKQSIKPYYFDEQFSTNDTQQSLEVKEVPKVQLGDLIEMDNDDFQEFSQNPAQAKTNEHLIFGSNVSEQGSYSMPKITSLHAFSPEKVPAPAPQLANHHSLPASSPFLDFAQLYNQQQQNTTQQQPNTQTSLPNAQNKYAYLQNLGRQPQQQGQQQMQAPNYQTPQQQGYNPQMSQPQGSLPTYQQQTFTNQHYQQQPVQQPNKPVNIMDLYGQNNNSNNNGYTANYQVNQYK